MTKICRCTGIGLSVLLYLVASHAQITVNANTANGPGVKVVVNRVLKATLPGNRQALSIKYEYNFSSLRSIHIKGLGQVPPSGTFSYLTSDDALIFSDPSSGTVIAKIPLKETVAMAASGSMTEIPWDFPAGVKVYDWNTARSLQESANRVLRKYFEIRVYEQQNINFIATTFTELTSSKLPKGITGRIALQLSFPFDPNTQTFSLHIQSIVQEGRELSDDFRTAESPIVVQEAGKFVDSLVSEVKAGGN